VTIGARGAAGALALGRVALGVAVLAAPERVTTRWLGRHARHPAVRYLAHSLGIRDVALGALALASLRDDGGSAAQVQAACAAADAVDAVATVAARSELPALGAAGTVAVAGGAAVAELYLARRLSAA
jgi:hypothetical protein